MRETIFALSTGAPPAGVAVIRISGPRVQSALLTLSGNVPPARMARLCKIIGADGAVLDQGLALFFPGPHSFTGEDVAELQIHGSRASINAVLLALSALEGLREAEPGEFTRRAFENGRMDLTAVEGLADLIRAETEAQRKQALGQSDGNLKSLYGNWAKRLTHARAMIEAELDFSDEEDIPGSVTDRIWPDLALLIKEIEAHLSKAKAAEIVREGFRIALIGPPNAGKSSLLNCLAQRDVAIVSETPGTTRDVVEIRLDIGGYLVLLQDTAGLRETEDAVEQEGIRRSMASAYQADLVLELVEPGVSPSSELPLRNREALLTVRTKIDLAANDTPDAASTELAVSSKTGFGIDALLGKIANRLSKLDSEGGSGLPTRSRHVLLLDRCLSDLRKSLREDELPIEVRSELLRSAATHIGRITGAVDVEDLLDVIFSEFCVGK